MLTIRAKLSLFCLLLFSFGAFATESIDSTELNKIVSNKGFSGSVLDVRTPFEWKDTGVIKGALTINANDSNLKNNLSHLDKKKKYYVYCHSGGRSSRVTQIMKKMGFKVVDINDGVSGWRQNKFPLEKYQETKK